jgi:hypothetical protein
MKTSAQLKIIWRNTDELKISEYNPRQMTSRQYEHLKESIDRFGLVDPIIVNIHPKRKDIVVGGNHRLHIAKAVGLKQVPTVEVSLDLERERELNIRLNKNTGEWDFDELADHFEITELLEWGFEEWELPPTPEAGKTSTDDERTFSRDEVSELDPVNHNIVECPKCHHIFHPKAKIDPKRGLNQYKESASQSGKSTLPKSRS